MGLNGKVIRGAWGLAPATPRREVEGSVTATQLSRLIKHQSWSPPGPTFVKNGNKCE